MHKQTTHAAAALSTVTNLTLNTGDCLGWPCQVAWGNTVSTDHFVMKDPATQFVFPSSTGNAPSPGTSCYMTLSAWGKNWNSSDNFNFGETATYFVEIKRTWNSEEISWSRQS